MYFFKIPITILLVSNTTVSERCLMKLFSYILVEEYINSLALEMASPKNQHCDSCIGTLSFPITIIILFA